MLLQHKNLTIRDALITDAAQLCRWWNDGAVMAHAGFPNGLNTTEEAVARQIANSTDKLRLLMIEIDGVPAGEMNYRDCGDGVAEIGIKICDSTKQQHGDGTLLLKMLIGSLFQDLGFVKIVLDTNAANTRAQHVYEKIGFKKLRVNENAWKDQLGQWQSSVDYALVPEDFTPLAG